MTNWFCLRLVLLVVVIAGNLSAIPPGRNDIDGVVIDPLGNGVEGVTVRILHSRFKATTSEDGEYSIDYVPGIFTLVFSKPRYTTHKLELKIFEKLSFPADTIIIWPIPEGQGIYYVSQQGLIRLPSSLVQGIKHSMDGISGWATVVPVPKDEELVIQTNGAPIDFVELSLKDIKPADASWYRGGLGLINAERSMIDEEIRKVGEQQLIVRTIRVLPGYYVWVQVKHLQDGLLIVGGVCFPFAIANPPLFQAAKEGNVADVEALLVEGANIDAFGDGESLDIPGWLDGLMVSAFVGHADIVRLFIDKGANVNATSPAYKEYGLEGLTPLMLAALGGHADVVGLLLHNGAKVNATVSSDDDEAEGITALMFAAMKGPIEVVRALLDAGSDVSAKTADGETALDIAEDAQVIQLLKEADAK